MNDNQKILIPLELIAQIIYYLNTRDDPRAWEFADDLQRKLDKQQISEQRPQNLNDWLEATKTEKGG